LLFAMPYSGSRPSSPRVSTASSTVVRGILAPSFADIASSSRACALYATNCEGKTWGSACRAYVDGRIVATGENIKRGLATIVVDEGDAFRAVAVELSLSAGDRRRVRR
jgi:hypothetical protein